MAIDRANDDYEIARLSIGAGNKTLQTLFYESLQAQAYNNLCSGSGEINDYSRQQIKHALARLGYLSGEDVTPLAKPGRNPFHELLQIISGADVLDNGVMLGVPQNVVVVQSPPASQMELYERVRNFYTTILDYGASVVTISFC